MKIVAGLGNPGAQYANTPHSVGFEALDALAAAAGVAWEEKRQFKCLMTAVSVAGERVLLVKPQTFMNLSGARTGTECRRIRSTHRSCRL